MRIVITGVGGFVGAHLAAAYAQAGHEVIGIDNYAWGLPRRSNANVTEWLGDITYVNNFPKLSKADLVIHSAAFASERLSHSRPDLCRSVNIHGTLNVADWSRSLGARLVHLSTGAIDSKPESPYSVSKDIAERIVRFRCPDATIIRLWCLYGPGQINHQEHRSVFAIWSDAAQHDRPIKVRGGEQTRQFTYLPDIELPRRILHSRPGEFIALGSARPVSVMHCAELFSRVTGAQIVLEPSDPNDPKEMGMPPTIPYAGGETPISLGLQKFWGWWQSEERSRLGEIAGQLGYFESTHPLQLESAPPSLAGGV